MPHTLLLADDSVTIQRVIELTFADEDIRVTAVSDGDQAIATIDHNPPDIVLADVGMPGRSGYEVAQHIRSTPRLAHIPVLLLTGAFEPIDQARANEVGSDGVLAKPFEPQLVISRVKELLAKARPRQTPQAPASIDAHFSPPPRPGAGWDNPFAEPAPPPAKAAAAQQTDNYFDRLDEAFASFSASGSTPAQPAPPAAFDWFGGKRTATEPPDLPLSYGSPQAAFDRTSDVVPFHPPAQERVAPQPAPPQPVNAPAVVPAQFPPLADAFAALLAAEQGAPTPASAPSWPAAQPTPASPVPAPAPPIDMDALVEKVTRRVLEHLSDQVVRETVSDIVSRVAERLVREEVERIKARVQ